MSPKQELSCPGNMFRIMVIDQVSIATEVANPEEKNADHLVSPSRPTYCVLPIQKIKMSGSRGSPCIYHHCQIIIYKLL